MILPFNSPFESVSRSNKSPIATPVKIPPDFPILIVIHYFGIYCSTVTPASLKKAIESGSG